MYNRDEMMQQMADLREELDEDDLDLGNQDQVLSSISRAQSKLKDMLQPQKISKGVSNTLSQLY